MNTRIPPSDYWKHHFRQHSFHIQYAADGTLHPDSWCTARAALDYADFRMSRDEQYRIVREQYATGEFLPYTDWITVATAPAPFERIH